MEARFIKKGTDRAGGAGVLGAVFTPQTASWFRSDWFWGVLLVAAVVLAYAPVWDAGYIWDDDSVVTANPVVVGPLGLKEIWTTSAADICPLTLSTFWLEHALWGVAPLPYHVVNVLMHGACAVVLWRVLRGLGVGGAWLGAALWALHPVEVESVAWITEMKNTESGLFFLLAVYFYGRRLAWTDRERAGGLDGNYAMTLVCAALAMASKSSTVILPVVLLLCGWWMKGRVGWRSWVEMGPIMLMSILAGLASMWTQGLHVAGDVENRHTWPERWAIAGDAVWFYLGKLVWPEPLMTIYPRWRIDAGALSSYVGLVLVALVLVVLWLNRKGWARLGWLAWAYFLVALLPILGLASMSFSRYSFVADHFQYLASMGPLALAGAGLTGMASVLLPQKPRVQASLAAALLIVLGITTWQRVWVYQSEETLWTDSLAKNPNGMVGYTNLGPALFQEGRVTEAIALYQQALGIYSRDAEIHSDLGVALVRLGRLDEAAAQFEQAVSIRPDFADPYYNLGLILYKSGRMDEAIADYRKALALKPAFAEAEYDLGAALMQKGQGAEAMGHFRRAVELAPDFAEAQESLGSALLQEGKMDEALAHLEKAVELKPGDAAGHNNLGIALAQSGRVAEAVDQFEEALRREPDYVPAQTNLARAKGMGAGAGPGR